MKIQAAIVGGFSYCANGYDCLIIKEKVLEGFKRYFGENSDFYIMFRNAYLKGLE
ncbi:hypothetical protein [Bacillus sp. AFS031507]|uniref:hypothetical protein n=1 Tax=Bacillus sp. AFS031507 TaxID=2033496 RepID=UPI0015D50A49|nr:hypothetical protein [Bacillus sp. AFS031507]